VPARNNTYPKERQNPTRISFLAEKCLKEDKTKKNKNMSARQKMFARRKKTKKITQNKKTSARKKKVCKKKKDKTKKKKMSAQKRFFARRKTKKPMTRSRAQVCKGWVLYSGALLVRSRFRIGEDQFLGKFAAIVGNKKMKKIFFPRYNLEMGMLSLSLSTVVAIQKVVRLRGSSRESCNRN